MKPSLIYSSPGDYEVEGSLHVRTVLPQIPLIDPRPPPNYTEL
jgi:hypothetical protein